MVNNHYRRPHQDCRTDKDTDFWFMRDYNGSGEEQRGKK